MDNKIVSGTEVARAVRQNLKDEVEKIRGSVPTFSPRLCIVQVGDRQDSNVYIRMKGKAAAEVGIIMDHVKLPSSTSQAELLSKLDQLNNDFAVHGIIVQMPLESDEPIDSNLITNAVDPAKDVDGLTTANVGKLAIGDITTGFIPCTPNGCMKLIHETGVQVQGANAVIVGK